MPRLQFNPNLIECPNFASDIYTASRARFVNDNTTEEEAIGHLQALWKAGNDAEKVLWQAQEDEDAREADEQEQLLKEAEERQAADLEFEKETARKDEIKKNKAKNVLWQAQEDEDAREADEQEQLLKEAEERQAADLEFEKETARKDEIKKNKAKYIPIPDREVPDEAPVIASQFAMKRLEKGAYVGMWYFTNAGVDDALQHSTAADDDAMVLQTNSEGRDHWVPAASTRVAQSFIEDKDLPWEDFCQAVPRMVMAMEDAGWLESRVEMFAQFWGSLQVHPHRSSRDRLDQKTLLVYQGEQRKLWHQAMNSPRGGYNISKINEVVMRKTREAVYWDARQATDNERDFRVDQRLASKLSNMTQEPHRRGGHSSNPRYSSDKRRRSRSPERSSSISRRQRSPADRGYHNQKSDKDFRSGTGRSGHSACAVCLGRHTHAIVECNAERVWNSAHPTISQHINKDLQLRNGKPICIDWQRMSGCSSSRHDARHICSGCGQATHGAQNCPRAEKASSANPV
ncbi:hypothetical protein JAAARDRAFT_54071 [Jaapia argillacea MUCL 33604]|uniref:Uncharacterized protein n=1 Tax=Jaapia argillacea MUCL 33604 TaxID=933084 RepID=A0A067Q4Y3_9AGAM|nr:hypothetical protein JAAARDRAFT_54071 [Jaapia argillacea MUCL 33604]